MKTAVQVLFEEMNQIRLEDESGNISALDFFKQQNEAFEKAKEMYKQNIINAHTEGYIIGGGDGELYDCKGYYDKLINK